MKNLILTLTLLLLFHQTILPQSGWYWQNPLPQGNILWDICDDANHPGRLFAAGDHGTILKKENLSDWQIVEQGNFENLYSIYFKGIYGWAVGYNGTILQNIDGAGNNWYPLNSGTTKQLLSVFFFDQLNGWTVGQDQTILRTTDGGTNWNSVSPTGSDHYFSVYFTSLLNGWIAGATGSFGIILKTTDGGSIWTNSLIPTSRMNSIKFIDENTGCVVGDEGRIYTTSNGGADWNLAVSNTTSDMRDFYMNSSGEGWAVGYDGTIIHTTNYGSNWNVETSPTSQTLYGIEGDYVVGWAGTILQRGVNWEIVSEGYTNNLRAIEFDIFTDDGYAVGDNGLILKTSDAGNTWLPEDSLTNYDLYDVEALYTCGYYDPDAVVIGEYGTVLLSYSGNWQAKNISTTDKLHDIHLAGFTGQMFVASEWGRIYKTTNYGDNWSLKHENMSYHLYAIDFANYQTGYAAGSSGAVLKTTDDGETWFDISPGGANFFRSIDFIYNKGWVVGLNGAIFRTTDGGSTWIETLPRVTNETLNKVKFIDENIGWIVGDYGTILNTDDGGVNWYVKDSPSNHYLTSVYFPETGIGWICGWDGVILQTNDGGGTVSFEIFERNYLNLSIPDPGELSDSIEVQISPRMFADLTLAGVTVMIDTVLHPDVSDLAFLLTHDGITDTLIAQSEISDTNIINCSLTDAACISIAEGESPYQGSYRPHSSLMVFSGMNPNGKWALKVVDMVSGNSGTLQSWGLKLFFDAPSEVESDYTFIPSEYEIYQNFPNPFNPSTIIRWQMPETGFVMLKIYDVLGREITTLVDEELSVGKHEVKFDASRFSSGIYFYQLKAGKFIQTKKMILLR